MNSLSDWFSRSRTARRQPRSTSAHFHITNAEVLEERLMCSAAPVKYPLDVPAHHSLPGAPVSLYIDFDGDFTESWGGGTPGLTPAFDVDGDAATFTDVELLLMQHVWERVAEMYSPFNIDVTTQNPGAALSEQTMRIVVGGDGAWAGGFGGISEIDSFSDPNRVNLSWAFVKGEVIGGLLANLEHGHSDPVVTTTEKTVAETIAHEAGHAFGLHHQRTFNSDGSVLSEYNGGDPLRAPIMGATALSERALWWTGPSISAEIDQDDLAVLTREINGFGYRPDEAGDSIETAVPLTQTSMGMTASGVITTTNDIDIYSFAQNQPGHAAIRLDVATRSAMLDARIEILNVQGAVMAQLDTSSLGEILTVELPAGQFFVAIHSHGEQGDIGQYRLTVHADVRVPVIAQLNEPKTVRPDQKVKLNLSGVTDPDGRVQSVRLFLDTNGDGVFNPVFDTQFAQITRFKRNGRATLVLRVDAFASGSNTVFAVPRDETDADGIAVTTVLNVQPPVRLTAIPKVVTAGEPLQLVAEDVLLIGTSIDSVSFYRDVNRNGRIDRRIDQLVTTDTVGGDGWTANFSTEGLQSGNQEFIAIATGANGKQQLPGFTSVIVNTPPRIESVTVFHEPELPFGIYTAQFSGLIDNETEVQMVDLFIDTNGNGLLDEMDEKLVTSHDIKNQFATARFSPGRLLPGTYHLFAIAHDTQGGQSAPATTTIQLGGG